VAEREAEVVPRVGVLFVLLDDRAQGFGRAFKVALLEHLHAALALVARRRESLRERLWANGRETEEQRAERRDGSACATRFRLPFDSAFDSEESVSHQ
jgi:hypothetical protein